MLPLLGLLFLLLVFGGAIPLFILVFAQRIRLASSPLAMLLVVAAVLGLAALAGHLMWSFHIESMALEMYHFPRWANVFARLVMVPLLASRLTDKALAPKARARAAELRARYGWDHGGTRMAMSGSAVEARAGTLVV